MKRVGYLNLLAGLLLSSAVASPTQANDRSVRGLMIPAASCQQQSVAAGFFDTAIWSVANGVTRIACALPINNIELGGTAADNDLSKFRVLFRDGDGPGAAATIYAALYYVNRSGVVGDLCGQLLSAASTTVTSATVPCIVDLTPGVFYGIRIEMVAGPTVGVEFRGIDFP